MKYEIWSNLEGRIRPFRRMPMMHGYNEDDLMRKSWEGQIDDNWDEAFTLDMLFTRFNADDRPNGKTDHSLSVGDVIVLDGVAYAIKHVGFRKLEKWEPKQLF